MGGQMPSHVGLFNKLKASTAAKNTAQGLNPDGSKKNSLKTCKPGYKRVNGKCVKK
tara:strand:- start:47 stop:214 length:168 start_codon:yes stop_codon:yes gene_type:complete